MWNNFLKHIVIIFGMLVFQLSVVPFLPGQLATLNLILVVLVFIAVVYNFYQATVYGIIWGVVLDLYSPLPFGAVLISLLITLYFVYKVFEHFLTNKSFYTLIGLTLVATVVNSSIIYIYSIILYFLNTKDTFVLKQVSYFAGFNFIYQMIFNIIFVVSLFLIFHHSSRKFNAVFVDTTKS